MIRAILDLLFVLSALVSWPVLALFFLFKPRWRRYLGLRIGKPPCFWRTTELRPIWIHGASVGETKLALALKDSLSKAMPDIPFVLTSLTPEGLDLLKDKSKGDFAVGMAPLDFSPIIDMFLARVRPRVLVLVETELWPNLLLSCRAADVPIVIANGRISDSNFPMYKLFKSLLAPIMAGINAVACQNEIYRKRFEYLGVSRGGLAITGSMKFDLSSPEVKENVSEVISNFKSGRPLIVFASTHQGEEKAAIDVLQKLEAKGFRPAIIVAPRHLQRGDEIAELLQRSSIPFIRRTQNNPLPSAKILLLDTLGELNSCFSLADAAFVGGSFAEVGGHNVLEPALAEIPVLFGPHVRNFRDETNLLINVGAGFSVKDENELAEKLAWLLSDPEAKSKAGLAGKNAVLENKGALTRTTSLIMRVLMEG